MMMMRRRKRRRRMVVMVMVMVMVIGDPPKYATPSPLDTQVGLLPPGP